MSLFRDFFIYLTRRKWLTPPPHQYIVPYSWRDATPEDVMLMKARLARSPQKAQDILKKRGTDRAVEVIRTAPKRRPIDKQERIERLVMKWQNAKLPRQKKRKGNPILRLQARYKPLDKG